MSRLRASLLSLPLAVLAGFSPATAGAATSPIATVTSDTPIAIAATTVAWSAYDASSHRYRLMLRTGDAAPVKAAVAPQRRPFDVSGTFTSDNREVFLYSRCAETVPNPDGSLKREYRCDLYRYDVSTSRERRMSEVSSRSADEAWPVMDVRGRRGSGADRIAFVRRKTIWDHDAGMMVSCDRAYTTTLSRPSEVKPLASGGCGETVGMALRQDPAGRYTLIQVTDLNLGGAGSIAQVLDVPLSGQPVRVLARNGGGEAGYVGFTSPSITSTAVWVATTGGREGVRQGVVKITGRGRAPTLKTFANTGVAGRFLRRDGGPSLLLRGTNGGISEEIGREVSASCTPATPCTLESVSGSPAAALAR